MLKAQLYLHCITERLEGGGCMGGAVSLVVYIQKK